MKDASIIHFFFISDLYFYQQETTNTESSLIIYQWDKAYNVLEQAKTWLFRNGTLNSTRIRYYF